MTKHELKHCSLNMFANTLFGQPPIGKCNVQINQFLSMQISHSLPIIVRISGLRPQRAEAILLKTFSTIQTCAMHIYVTRFGPMFVQDLSPRRLVGGTLSFVHF